MLYFYQFLYRNLKGYRFLVAIIFILTFVQVVADILNPLPFKFILDKMVNHKDPNFPGANVLLSFFDQFGIMDHLRAGETRTQLSVILFSVVSIMVLSLLSALMFYIQFRLASLVAQNLAARLRGQLFEHLQRLSLDWHGKQKKGDLVQRITGNITDIEKFVTDTLIDLLSSSLTLIGTTFIMLIISSQYAVLSITIIPVLFIIVFGYTRSIKAAAKRAAKAAGQVADVVFEDINALDEIRAFTLEERQGQRFRSYLGKNREAGLRAAYLQAQFTPIVAILVAIGTVIIVGIGAFVVEGNTFHLGAFIIPADSVTIGTMILFLTYLRMFYQPIRDLSKATSLSNNYASGAERIQEVLAQAPEVLDTKAPYYGPQKLRGEITFDNVVFGYTKEYPVLNGINLHIPAGQKVALVGLSGAGKTTLTKLIPRFYEIQYGSVKIDGVDNRLYPLAVLRQNVSVVLQESILFEGTIHENIAIGRPEASMEEIVDAAKKANIHYLIMSLPDGYETLVRNQGKNFSGGQRQRIAIARAILRDAPVLILDEPTASLDVEAEAEVLQALDKLLVGRTVLMISHRLSTLGIMDEIIVFNNGRIVEQGTYKELKHRAGVFATLLQEQNRYSMERVDEPSIIRSAFIGPPAFVPVSGGSPTQPLSQHVEQPPSKAQVSIEIEGRITKTRLLDKSVLTIGRLSDSDVQIPFISRRHATIRWMNGTWQIEDMESPNGLIHNGQLIDQLSLKHGDRVYLGPKVAIQYEALP